MKFFFFLTFILTTSISYSQLNQLPWEEEYQFEALLDQADGSSVSVDITNTGSDVNDCIRKAKSQALFTIIFKGYPKTNNASASVSLTDLSNYNQNLDFYKNYLASNTAGLAHINKFETNIKKPGGKIDKKTIKSTTTIYILKTKLREDLQNLGYIKSAAKISEQLGITPTILIIPSESWMKQAGYAKSEITDMGEIWSYDYQNALTDPKMAIFTSIEGFLKPTMQKNGFRVLTLTEIMTQLTKANFESKNRKDKTQEDPLDILARTAQADIWLKVNLVQENLSGGQELQYQLTLNGIDPLLMESKINGVPQTIKTANNNLLKLVETTVNASIDNILPELVSFFEKRDKDGLPGKVEFQISEQLSFTFDDELTIEGESYSFSEIVDAQVSKKSTKYNTSGQSTSAIRSYDVIIPSKMENKLSGKVEMNNYEKFARKVNSELKNLLKDQNLTAIVENKGLGRVVVIFTVKP
jgi:hypothetical protein